MRSVLSAGALALMVGLGGSATAWGQSGGEVQPATPAQPAGEGAMPPASPAPLTPSPSPAPDSGPAPDGAALPPGQAGTPTPPPATYGTRRKLVLEPTTTFQNPKRYTLTLSGGFGSMDEPVTATVNDTAIEAEFAYDTPTFRFQLGRQFHDQFQFQLDLARSGFSASDVKIVDQSETGEDTLLKQYSASLGFAYRFDYVEEQPVVPYLAVGVMDTLGAFSQDQPTGAEVTYLNRFGGYVGGGLEILLDMFEPARAADLELSTGINDTYLVVDARYNWQPYLYDAELGGLQKDAGLQFTGYQITFGLKFDF